jgi:hypothetical protein
MEDKKPDIRQIPEPPAIKSAVRAALDFAYSMTIAEFLGLMDEHKVTKVGPWVTSGPGGGNPNIELHFEDREHAMAYLKAHYPDDTEEFHASLLR